MRMQWMELVFISYIVDYNKSFAGCIDSNKK